MESKSSSPRAPVFGRKGAISPGQSGTFGSFDRAKAGKFAGEFTETIQNDSPLKRFLSSSIVELLTFGGNCLHFRAKPAHISGHLPVGYKSSTGKLAEGSDKSGPMIGFWVQGSDKR
jgi:hypothetical protein